MEPLVLLAENLILLNAMLRYHSANFQLLHWNAVGKDFDDAHEDITTNYYTMCDEYIDSTAEMAARLNYFVYGYEQVGEVARQNGWTSVDANRLVERTDIVAIASDLLAELNSLIDACLECEEMNTAANAGIRSEIENMKNAFDLEMRFINKRRGMWYAE